MHALYTCYAMHAKGGQRPEESVRGCAVYVLYNCSLTDEEYVTGYGVQVLGYFYDDGEEVCTRSTSNLRAIGSDIFPNKVRFT